MNCCMRLWKRSAGDDDVAVSVEEKSEWPPTPHSSRKAGREVMR